VTTSGLHRGALSAPDPRGSARRGNPSPRQPVPDQPFRDNGAGARRTAHEPANVGVHRV